MRYIGAGVVLAISFALSQPVFAGDKLTNELAQNALDKWAPGDGTKQVVGVMDFPQESAARADIKLTNFTYDLPKNDPITAYAMGPGGGKKTFNGDVQAIFKHYTDGRWILATMVTPMGNWDNLNIEAGAASKQDTSKPYVPKPQSEDRLPDSACQTPPCWK